MPTLTLRDGLGRPLTYEEMDDNLLFVESKAQEASSSADAAGLAAQSAEADRQAAQTAAGLAEDDAQSAAGSASTAQYWAEEAQSIVTDGVVDDSGPSSVTTYSSELIETKLGGKADDSTQVIAGTGLSGGGNLTANRTLSVNYGTTSGTAAQGNDSRIVNATPNTRQIISGTGLSGGGNLTANRTLSVNYGTAAGTAAQGNDSRLSNSREWTASTVSQSEAQAGSATTRRAWTAQRVRQAVVAWWDSVTSQRLELSTASYASATSSAGFNTSANAVVRVDASANRTLSLTNPPALDRAQVVTVLLTGNTGMITWPSAIRWSGGAAPDLMATWTAVTLMWAGDGYWYGFASGGAD